MARVIQRFSKKRFHSEQNSQGSIKDVESLCCASGAEAGFKKNRCMSAASIALEVSEAEGQLVSAQTIPHTLQQLGLHGRHSRRKSLLKLAHKKACKQFAKTTWPRT